MKKTILTLVMLAVTVSANEHSGVMSKAVVQHNLNTYVNNTKQIRDELMDNSFEKIVKRVLPESYESYFQITTLKAGRELRTYFSNEGKLDEKEIDKIVESFVQLYFDKRDTTDLALYIKTESFEDFKTLMEIKYELKNKN